MDKYYYLVAQLPTLVFDRDNPITTATFLEEAEKWLSKSDLKALKSIQLFGDRSKSDGAKVWKSYLAFETRFREEIGLWRQSRREGQEYKPETFQPALVKDNNPLEAEKKLLRARWNVIEAEEPEHHFDLGFLILYYLKLQILDKLSVFDHDMGMEKFKTISKVTV
jgi:hypothetical protein